MGGQISPTSFECRTIDSMSKSASEFQQSGAQKENAKHYKNCEHIPLIPEKDLLIKHVSGMPLHLSLGVGLQFINIVKNAAVSLDVEIREANGLTSDGVIESYNKQHLLEEEIMAATVQADEISEQVILLYKQKSELEAENPEHFVKENGKLKNHSSEAKATRKQASVISKEIKDLEEEVRNLKKTINAKNNELKELDKSIDDIKGPFKAKFDDLMDSLRLKRQVYHTGALVGNDI